MAKIYNDFKSAKDAFQGAMTKKGGMNYKVGATYTIPYYENEEDYLKILGHETVQGTRVPCLILEQGGLLFLSSITKRIYEYEYNNSNELKQDFKAGGLFVCTGFVEDDESDVFNLVASCANQFDAVMALAGKTIELYQVDKYVSAGGDFKDENGRTTFTPTKLVEKQLPRFRFVDTPKAETATEAETEASE